MREHATAEIHRRNLAAYQRRLTIRDYRRATDLQPPEAAILARLAPTLAGGRILDIGVGGGRTTPHLLRLSRDYLGIDYSPGMVEACRARFPSVAFRQMDARDLSAFADGSFDLVMFSFNGLDVVDHADRLRILAEVRRVLAEGGAFVFSSHNRDAPLTGPWSLSRLRLDRAALAHPLNAMRRILAYPVGIRNYHANAPLEREEEEYALRNDGAHEFGLVQYYIRAERQVRQLEALGFRGIEVLDLDGNRLAPPGYRCGAEHAWLYYLCRR